MRTLSRSSTHPSGKEGRSSVVTSSLVSFKSRLGSYPEPVNERICTSGSSLKVAMICALLDVLDHRGAAYDAHSGHSSVQKTVSLIADESEYSIPRSDICYGADTGGAYCFVLSTLLQSGVESDDSIARVNGGWPTRQYMTSYAWRNSGVSGLI